MIQFKNINNQMPFVIFKERYDEALISNEKNIEAMTVSSFDMKKKEVNSRVVNLKIINNESLIFFSNYNSPKSIAFDSHDQISALIFWPTINTQIRMKAKIKRTTSHYNQSYFQQRNKEKNALAISSDQSMPIRNYETIVDNYLDAKKNKNLSKCPSYWGGFEFKPYEIEFWKGHNFRLNRRDLYIKNLENWEHYILQP